MDLSFSFLDITGQWRYKLFVTNTRQFLLKGISIIDCCKAYFRFHLWYLLHSINTTPFRCEVRCDFPQKPPQDQVSINLCSGHDEVDVSFLSLLNNWIIWKITMVLTTYNIDRA